MFIAGTRTLSDWWDNWSDLSVVKIRRREEEEKRIGRAAIENNPQVVYGHSRGGALLADMVLPPCMQKVGLSAAMSIARNKDMLNLNEGVTFDAAIGVTGNNNVKVDFSPEHIHKVWFVS